MDQEIRKALDADSLVDITTVGRKSGISHRIEVNLRHVDGQIYLSNKPGTRDWAANLMANPEFVYHLKQSIRRDLRARAIPEHDPVKRRDLFTRILEKEGALNEVEERTGGSHLFRVELLE